MTRFDHLFQQGLERLTEQGRLRTLRSLNPTRDGRLVRADGTALIDFSSNDYLGLRLHPLLHERATEWGMRYGTGSGASRLVSGTSSAVLRLENRLANLKGMEAACILSSGWQANATLVPALARLSVAMLGAPPVIFADKLMHASLYQGCAAAGVQPVRFRHNDVAHLTTLLQKQAESPGLKIVLTESVFSMDGDRADLQALATVCKKHEAFLCVDEAHATGILGENGQGLAHGMADLVIGTFSKALGCMGAFVASSQPVCRWLMNSGSGFIYSTAPSPMVLGAVDAALDLLPTPEMQAIRDRVAQLSARLRDKMRQAGLETGLSTTQIVPVLMGHEHTALHAAQSMEAAGFLSVAIRPPTVPPAGCRLRLVVQATHTQEQVDSLAQAIATHIRRERGA